jgi:hypothetical protein
MPFGGCGAFLVALRIIKQAYVLVGLSECSGVLQDLVESMHPPALHPDLRTYDEAGSDDATIHALPADLVLCGFPCPPQSNLPPRQSLLYLPGSIPGATSITTAPPLFYWRTTPRAHSRCFPSHPLMPFTVAPLPPCYLRPQVATDSPLDYYGVH